MSERANSDVSLATYATLLAHLKHFPVDTHDDVLSRLDFEPAAWPDYAKRAEAQLARALRRGEATPEFDDVFGDLRRELKKRKPTVQDLPLDAEQAPGEVGPVRSMRLRDIDPVQFLEILSARLPRIHVVPHGDVKAPARPAPPPPRTVPRPVTAFPELPAAVIQAQEPPAYVEPATEDPIEAARRRSQEARARFESTQVSPSSPGGARSDVPLNVTVQVSQSQFPGVSTEAEEPVTVDAVSLEPVSQEEEALNPASPVGPSGLSLFEFANLCAEYNQCPPGVRETVRLKYGIESEARRLELLDTWRERLVDNAEELAEWRKLYDAAMRHWHLIHKGHEA